MNRILIDAFFFLWLVPSVSFCSAQNYNNRVNGFLENKGQLVDQNGIVNNAVKYLYSSPGFNVQLRQTGFSYDTYSDSIAYDEDLFHRAALSEEQKERIIRKYHRVDIELLGCNKNPVIQAIDPSVAYFNYFTTGTSHEGISNVRCYQKVIYKNIYDNIDLEFFVMADTNNATGVGMEYQFVLHKGADIHNIKLEYSGANHVELKNGKINVDMNPGKFEEKIPLSYFAKTGKRIEVKYISEGNEIFSLRLPDNFSVTEDIIIDPMPCLLWSTYFGTAAVDAATAVCYDSQGNILVTGGSYNLSGLATTGAYQSTVVGQADIYISKFNATGTQLLWGTYYGGTLVDESRDIAFAPDSSIIITGNTKSTTNISTPGAFQSNFGGQTDILLARFNSNGTTLLWGTYYGGPGIDAAEALIIDSIGNIYITGDTRNTLGTVGAYQPGLQGVGDAFASKFNLAGTRIWTTHIGGLAVEIGYDIELDAQSNVYVTGYTVSSNGIATPGVFSPNFNVSGSDDGFVVKIHATGSALIWGTYVGGNSFDLCYSIELDDNNNVFVAGTTMSPTGISTIGSSQPIHGGLTDGFTCKISASGDSLLYGTYFGGTDHEYHVVIKHDFGNHIYMTGSTTSTAGIASVNAFQPSWSGDRDVFVARIDLTGVNPMVASYYGGPDYEYPDDIAISPITNEICVVGLTQSLSGISTSGVLQPNHAGGSPAKDSWIATFGCFCSTPAPNQPDPMTGPINVCAGTSQTYTLPLDPAVSSYTWTLPNSWTGTSNTNSINVTVGSTSGTISVTANNSCGPSVPQTLYVNVNNVPPQPSVIAGNQHICANSTQTYSVVNNPAANSYTWTLPGDWSGSSSINSINVTAGILSGNISVTANNICGSSIASIYYVEVDTGVPVQPSIIDGETEFCENETFNFSVTNDTSVVSYSWSIPIGWTGTSTSNLITGITATSGGTVMVTANNTCGTSLPQTLTVTIHSPPSVIFNLVIDTVCIDNTPFQLTNGTPAGGAYSGTGVVSGQYNAFVDGIGSHIIIYTFTDINGCDNSDTSSIFVDNCTGIFAASEPSQTFEIYPNPVHTELTIQADEIGLYQLQLIDNMGKIISTCNFISDQYKIDFSQYAQGIYFLNLTGKNNGGFKVIKL